MCKYTTYIGCVSGRACVFYFYFIFKARVAGVGRERAVDRLRGRLSGRGRERRHVRQVQEQRTDLRLPQPILGSLLGARPVCGQTLGAHQGFASPGPRRRRGHHHRPAHQRRRGRQGGAPPEGRAGQRGESGARTGGLRNSRRQLLSTDRADKLRTRHALLRRGDVWAFGCDPLLRVRVRCPRNLQPGGQLRAGGLLGLQRSGPLLPRRPGLEGGHGGGERGRHLDGGGALRRREAVGPRSGGRPRGTRRVPRHQIHLPRRTRPLNCTLIGYLSTDDS
mmetsp:Transcript_54402/g.124012  ORF Transcript_54402/g.124012 Transcript_54402/m.124012 type:complete len:278 (-) Transcript_54402:25-858(-)